MTGKCKNCNNLKNDWCEMVVDSPDPDMVRDCRYFSHMTYADRIRRFNDEELADWLMRFLVASGKATGFEDVQFGEGYREGLLELLRQPVKDGDNE